MTFEWPTLLLALGLVPIFCVLYVLAQRRRRAYAVRFTNLALLASVVPRGPGLRRHVPPLLFLLGLAAVLASLARPSAVINVPKDQAAVMLVMDVSGSMAASDLKPSRLEAAKEAAGAFIDALPDNARVGVVAFSSGAGVRVPLTQDGDAVKRAIQGLTPNGGTAIGDGLRTAVEQLARRPAGPDGQAPPAMVVLLSDGQATEGYTPPADAAAQAQQAGIKVHTVGIGQRGTQTRVTVNGRSSQLVGLDEATLNRIADTTGGRYFYARESGQLEQIYADLGSQVTWVQERTEITAVLSGLGAVVLSLGGLLSLRWFQQFP